MRGEGESPTDLVLFDPFAVVSYEAVYCRSRIIATTLSGSGIAFI